MSDHEELESSVPAWVLGALEPDEAETIRAHVDSCATCREAVQRLRRVAGVLPLSVDEVTPPPRLRDRVLAAAGTRTATPLPAIRGPRPRPIPPQVGLARRMPVYAMAAVAVVALLLGVIVGQLALRPAPSPEVARHTLTGHQDMSGAHATVIDLRADDVALVDFSGLPAPGTGRVYEVWLIPAKGDPVAAAVFVPDGNGARIVLVNRSLAGYTQMAVTNEAGPDGAAQPTQQPQLYGSLA
jgi:anti-sigma-K factor RskA